VDITRHRRDARPRPALTELGTLPLAMAGAAMTGRGRPRLGQVDHVALSVTDLDASLDFYTRVLGFVPVMRVPGGRICLHPDTLLLLALVTHEAGDREAFSELHTGVDHLGLEASSREEVLRWERHLDSHGVRYTPVRDELFGSHLNFRDPDGIALEITSSNELMVAARAAFDGGRVTTAEIDAFVEANLGPEFTASSR
jgi:glyoxylase I family protein